MLQQRTTLSGKSEFLPGDRQWLKSTKVQGSVRSRIFVSMTISSSIPSLEMEVLKSSTGIVAL
jgi:hypothetical protein